MNNTEDTEGRKNLGDCFFCKKPVYSDEQYERKKIGYGAHTRCTPEGRKTTEATFENKSVPKGQANVMLVDDLRGHAHWLSSCKGYDHFSKQLHWAANIIEGLND
jgi:hypothetical protein